ncbi:hypothetical protein K493DRAFT_320563 [Basidiobolus meristosporus CBS 931.73]|uniref:Late endosomal/lysosomal adaptor and MAPK and MTOR activator 5 n=1 Tax=Basidiobolus meristosporus CBS 931.73 TaxID=1314790 RepID=A0A1Y1X813_9FUNG|nr:hypothetical protein K493DRAFT_320563 [Basidiobolus meristosporus CBS 931.73]|eukprot:ORX81913.1 hypothetical protein K493DRAFT_320563 [Basidiobolus meristosporus CBS 931.73]
MEANLETIISNLLGNDGVKGVLLADHNGLCLASRGAAPASAAGFISSIANRAQELMVTQENDAPAVSISIETQEHTIVIRREKEMTLAIYK